MAPASTTNGFTIRGGDGKRFEPEDYLIPGKTEAASEKYLHTAYLLSRYPAISHTFFLQEIAGLRLLDIFIETASINPPDRDLESLSAAEREESERTLYLKGTSILRLLPRLLRIGLVNPAVVFRGLAAALKLWPWHLTQSLYALFYLAEALLVGDWMRQRRLSHLHIHFSGPVATVGMLTSLAWRVPYSLTVHGPDEFFDQNANALQAKIRNAAFVICISDYCRSQLMRICTPDTWQKFHVIRLGVMPELADLSLQNRYGHQSSKNESTQLRVLCTGRLVGAKGQAILIKSLDSLVRRGHDVLVTFIGDGADRKVLEELVDTLGIGDRVIFAGSKSHAEVIEALRASDLFVLPSFAEGVPVALMEAMAIGVPCISTFIAGIPELIRHEIDGLLVPAGSVEDLTQAMERLLMSAEECERFRASAREHVLTHYNLPRNLVKLAATLTELAPHAVVSNHE